MNIFELLLKSKKIKNTRVIVKKHNSHQDKREHRTDQYSNL